MASYIIINNWKLAFNNTGLKQTYHCQQSPPTIKKTKKLPDLSLNILWTNSWGQVTRSILFTYTSDQHAAHIPRKGVANTVWKLTAGWQGGCKYPPIYLPIDLPIYYLSTHIWPIYLPTYYNIYISIYLSIILFYSTLLYSTLFYSILSKCISTQTSMLNGGA
jgi:hypothetical protein